MEEPGLLESLGSPRVGHNLKTGQQNNKNNRTIERTQNITGASIVIYGFENPYAFFLADFCFFGKDSKENNYF